MNSIINHYKNKEVFLVGGFDSLGVPYTADNTKMKSFIELTADRLKKMGIDLTYCNISSLGMNKTWELQQVLDKDYTAEYYNRYNQNLSEYVISGKRKEESWPFPTNPEFVDKFYKVTMDPHEHITTKLRESEAPIFLYSCGGMNIRQYLKINSEMTFKDFLLCAREVILRFRKHVRKAKQDIDSAIKQISELNPNMEIYVLGVYAMLDNQTLRNLVGPVVRFYNYQLKKILAPYKNVHYVDITKVKNMVAPLDMHPTYEGQVYISNQLIKVMDTTCKNKSTD